MQLPNMDEIEYMMMESTIKTTCNNMDEFKNPNGVWDMVEIQQHMNLITLVDENHRVNDQFQHST
jgi:hypothetical protein